MTTEIETAGNRLLNHLRTAGFSKLADKTYDAKEPRALFIDSLLEQARRLHLHGKFNGKLMAFGHPDYFSKSVMILLLSDVRAPTDVFLFQFDDTNPQPIEFIRLPDFLTHIDEMTGSDTIAAEDIWQLFEGSTFSRIAFTDFLQSSRLRVLGEPSIQ